MKKILLPLALLTVVLPLSAAAETWKDVPVVDSMCSAKAKAEPDKHSTQCALACAKSGFGILTAEGSYLKFDETGNEKVVAALKETKKKDHLRVTVTGDRDGDTIRVKSLSFE